MDYSKEQIDQLIEDVYSGLVSVENLPPELYRAIAKYLGGALDTIKDTASKPLLAALQNNLFEFSGAKTYSQIKEMSLVADNETIKSFADFKAEALKIYEQYNVDWLQTEYSTAVASAQNAVRWDQIQEQKKTLPFLRYSAVMDSQTSEICAPLDGITLPIDDPFWLVNSPENHFNCRCTLEQEDEFDANVSDADVVKETADYLDTVKQPLFNNNVGVSREIFTKEHPYFKAEDDG